VSLKFLRMLLVLVIIVALTIGLFSTAYAQPIRSGTCQHAPGSALQMAPPGPDAVGLCCFRVLGICWCVICQYPGWNQC
jgi:hypothetical protein